MPRDFDIAVILTVVTDRFVSTMDGVLEFLAYMTGEPIFTHVIPRSMTACQPALIAQHPLLATVTAPEWDETRDREPQVYAWLDNMRAILGDTLPVTPLDEWHHIDPVREYIERSENPNVTVAVVDNPSV